MRNLAIVLTGVLLTVAALWTSADYETNKREISVIFTPKRAIASSKALGARTIHDDVQGLVSLKVGENVKVVQESWRVENTANL